MGINEDKTDAEMKAGLKSWVDSYKVMRKSGNVKGAKYTRDAIMKIIKDKKLDAKKVWGDDPDDPKNKVKESYILSEKAVYSKSDINNIVDAADMAFWGTVADMVPEADSGDLDPGLVGKLNKMQTKAVTSWIAFNTVHAKSKK